MKRLIFILAMSLCFLGCEKSPDAAAGAPEPASPWRSAGSLASFFSKGEDHGAAAAGSLEGYSSIATPR